MQGWVGIEPVGWLFLQSSGIQTASWSKVFLQGSRDVNEASWAWGCKVEAEARKSEDEAEARAFQFGQKSFDSIRFSLPNRFFRFDSIRQSDKFAASTLIFKYGEFCEGPGGVSLRCGPFCAISVSIRQHTLENNSSVYEHELLAFRTYSFQ